MQMVLFGVTNISPEILEHILGDNQGVTRGLTLKY
jgi:hypothetical protein